jgi:hypothetical protein
MPLTLELLRNPSDDENARFDLAEVDLVCASGDLHAVEDHFFGQGGNLDGSSIGASRDKFWPSRVRGKRLSSPRPTMRPRESRNPRPQGQLSQNRNRRLPSHSRMLGRPDQSEHTSTNTSQGSTWTTGEEEPTPAIVWVKNRSSKAISRHTPDLATRAIVPGCREVLEGDWAEIVQ